MALSKPESVSNIRTVFFDRCIAFKSKYSQKPVTVPSNSILKPLGQEPSFTLNILEKQGVSGGKHWVRYRIAVYTLTNRVFYVKLEDGKDIHIERHGEEVKLHLKLKGPLFNRQEYDEFVLNLVVNIAFIGFPDTTVITASFDDNFYAADTLK